MQTEQAIEKIIRGGGVTKTTTRYYGPQRLTNNLSLARARISVLQQELRALKNALVLKTLDMTPANQSPMLPPPPQRRVNKQLQTLENQKLRSSMTSIESSLTDIETQLVTLGQRVKVGIDHLVMNTTLPRNIRERKKQEIVALARRRKINLVKQSHRLKQRLEMLRKELSGIILS